MAETDIEFKEVEVEWYGEVHTYKILGELSIEAFYRMFEFWEDLDNENT